MDTYNHYDEQRRRDPVSVHQPYFAVPSANLSLTIPTQPYSYAPLSADGYNYSPVEPRLGTGYYMTPTISPTSPADYRSPITPADYLSSATSFGPAVVTSPSSTHTYGYYGGYSGEVTSTSHGLYGVGFEVPQPPQKGSEPENHVPTHQGSPFSSVVCQWNMCGKYIAVDQNALCAHLREHLALESPLPTRERVCRWVGCVCAAKTDKSGRCNNQPMGYHPTHVQYIEQHVWDVHFGLRWFCNRCFQADFTTKRSMERHQKQGCSVAPTAPVLPLICAACTFQMQSQAEMDVHARVCTGRP